MVNMEITYVEGVLFIILFWMGSRVYSKIYKYLKSQNIIVNKKLYSAVCNGHIYTVRSILSTNVDVNVRVGRDNNSLLHYAPNAEVTRELLSHGAQVDALNDDGMSPLFFAIIDNKGLAVVQELLQHGADVNLKTNDGHTALHLVPCLTDSKGLIVVRELLKCGANVNAFDSDNITPLFFAVMGGTNLSIIKELLMNGADISVRGRYPLTTRYFTPLDLAVDEEKLPHAKLIIKITLIKHFDEDYKRIIDLDSYIGSFDYSVLSLFLDNCVSELLKMKDHKINSTLTFFEFVSKISDIDNVKPLYTSNNITEQEITTKYPIYHDIFWPNMKMSLERANLLTKLTELQIYVESNNPSVEDIKEKVVLNHDCLYKIGEYLSNDDLLNFISGFEKVLSSFHIFRTTL